MTRLGKPDKVVFSEKLYRRLYGDKRKELVKKFVHWLINTFLGMLCSVLVLSVLITSVLIALSPSKEEMRAREDRNFRSWISYCTNQAAKTNTTFYFDPEKQKCVYYQKH